MSNLLAQDLVNTAKVIPNDLFNSDNITDLLINRSEPNIFRKHTWVSYITYKSGDFSAEKKFEADNLPELLSMMGTFIQQVK